MMSAMQNDMTSTTTTCYVCTEATNVQIAYVADVTNYANETFNPADALNYGQVLAILLME